MSNLETINIAVYPWANPTDTQKAAFDRLSDHDKRAAIDEAIQRGFESGPAEPLDIDTFISAMKSDLKNAL